MVLKEPRSQSGFNCPTSLPLPPQSPLSSVSVSRPKLPSSPSTYSAFPHHPIQDFSASRRRTYPAYSLCLFNNTSCPWDLDYVLVHPSDNDSFSRSSTHPKSSVVTFIVPSFDAPSHSELLCLEASNIPREPPRSVSSTRRLAIGTGIMSCFTLRTTIPSRGLRGTPRFLTSIFRQRLVHMRLPTVLGFVAQVASSIIHHSYREIPFGSRQTRFLPWSLFFLP